MTVERHREWLVVHTTLARWNQDDKKMEIARTDYLRKRLWTLLERLFVSFSSDTLPLFVGYSFKTDSPKPSHGKWL